MSKCNSISWLKITGMCNLDVIHICAIEACVWDFESLVSFAIFLCDDPCMESRYHNFILVRIQEYVWRWRISTDYGYIFVDSEKEDKQNHAKLTWPIENNSYNVRLLLRFDIWLLRSSTWSSIKIENRHQRFYMAKVAHPDTECWYMWSS